MRSEGELLTEKDRSALAQSFINAEFAEQAKLFRVDSSRGRELIGRRNGSGDYSGIAFPYFLPGNPSPREYRLRRDQPELERQQDGSIKEKQKYLSPPGRSNLLYFVPGTRADCLTDNALPIVVTEGEKKAIALYRLALLNAESIRFLPIGLAGVWGWRGRVGKTTDAKGERREIKGVINDFDRLTWDQRLVYIVFDANVATNEKVKAARSALGKELRERGADVRFVDLPQIQGINGVDDLMASKGPEYVLGMIAGAQPSEEPGRKSQATKLIELAKNVEVFHTPDDEPYASFRINGHLETWRIKSRGFRDFLTRLLYKSERKAPNAQSIQDAINLFASRARFEGKTREVHLRIAQCEGAIYLDLVDDAWRVVRVDNEGWHIIASELAPARFRRTTGMLPLPDPIQGYSIDTLRNFVNVTDHQWPLLLGVLVAYFRPNYAFPLLALHGEQGSAKSTTARIVRAIIDPNKAPLRSEPRDERDLQIAANNGWVVAFDNLSRISPSLSDSICRLATGGGFGTRKLYENDEEVLFDAKRPVVVNGIEELATRSDLLDRTVILMLPAISDTKRRTEAELWNEFERQRAGILGAVLNAVSYALCNEETVRLDRLPRMADFAKWVVASEPALGLNEGEFMSAYLGNRESANDIALEGCAPSSQILALVEECGQWQGTTSELLIKLNSRTTDELRKQAGWPRSPQSLSGMLKRFGPNFRAIGLNVSKGTGRQRRIWFLDNAGNSSSPSSQSSPTKVV